MRKIYKQGFTLIEILFVIAILSVLASLGISVLQQRAQQLKVERTALQMQQILQAGMAFKADAADQKWPECGPTPPKSPNFDKYMPTGLSLNPWGYTYFCGKPEGKEVFQVKVQVPGSATNTKIADQIIALLPNAGKDVTTDPTKAYVFTEVSGTGGGGTTTEKIVFKDVGSITICDSSDGSCGADRFTTAGVYTYRGTIPISCPSGMTGHLLFLPQSLAAGVDWYTTARVIRQLQYDEGCPIPAVQSPRCTPTITFTAVEQGKPSPTLPLAATSAHHDTDYEGYTSPGRLTVQYLSYCIKTG